MLIISLEYRSALHKSYCAWTFSCSIAQIILCMNFFMYVATSVSTTVEKNLKNTICSLFLKLLSPWKRVKVIKPKMENVDPEQGKTLKIPLKWCPRKSQFFSSSFFQMRKKVNFIPWIHVKVFFFFSYRWYIHDLLNILHNPTVTKLVTCPPWQ